MRIFSGKMSFLAVMVLLATFLGTETVQADRRGYVWTYEYMTMPKGQSEIEYYLTTKVPDIDDYDEKNTWEHQLEYEYGLTDHWDIAIYQRFKKTNSSDGDSFDYTGSKFRTRFRLGEKDQLPIDTLLYIEYIKPDDSGSPDIFEGKLILAKDLGKFNIAYNQIVKVGLNSSGKTEHEYAAGINYEFNPSWRVGLESTGNFTEEKYLFGPTVSWASEKFWVGFGVLGGLNNRSDDLRARFIIGIPF